MMWSVAAHWESGPGVSWVVWVKTSPHLCSALGHLASAIKQTEMAATFSRLGDSQVNLSCEFMLAAAIGRPEAH